MGLGLAAISSALALALGLAACGDDDDSAATPPAPAAAEITLELGYVTTPQHPYGLAVDAVHQGGERGLGRLDRDRAACRPTREATSSCSQDVSGGAVEMASISSAVWARQASPSSRRSRRSFLITSYDLEERGHQRRPIGESDARGARRRSGLVGLAIHEGGLRKPLGAERAGGPADFKGKKIRAPQSNVLPSRPQRPRRQRRRRSRCPTSTRPCRTAPSTAWRRTSAWSTRRSSTRSRSSSPANVQPVAVPDGAGDQQGRVRRPDRRAAGDRPTAAANSPGATRSRSSPAASDLRRDARATRA